MKSIRVPTVTALNRVIISSKREIANLDLYSPKKVKRRIHIKVNINPAKNSPVAVTSRALSTKPLLNLNK